MGWMEGGNYNRRWGNERRERGIQRREVYGRKEWKRECDRGEDDRMEGGDWRGGSGGKEGGIEENVSGRERVCGICVGGRVSGMNQSVSQSVSQSNWFLSIYKSSFNLFRTTPKYRPQCFAFVPSVSGLCCAVLCCAALWWQPLGRVICVCALLVTASRSGAIVTQNASDNPVLTLRISSDWCTPPALGGAIKSTA